MDEAIRTAAISPLRQRLIDGSRARRNATTFGTLGALRHSSGVHPIQPRQMMCADFRSNSAIPACRRRSLTMSETEMDLAAE